MDPLLLSHISAYVCGKPVCVEKLFSYFDVRRMGLVDNFEYGNFENLTLKKFLESGELSSPLSTYSYCRSVLLAGLGKGMSAPGRAREGDS